MSEVYFNNVALSQRRLTRVEGAQSLGEAQRMGLFDRVVDWLRGGEKKEAIRQAYELLHSPEGDASAPKHAELLLHFNVLQCALRSEHMGKCELTVQRDDERQTWSYSMQLDGQTLVRASALPIGAGHALAAFEDQALLAQLGNYLHQDFGADTAQPLQLLREQFSAINEGHADPAGKEGVAARLEKFRCVSASLEQLGAPARGCFPVVQLSHDLRTAELVVGKHVLGEYALTSQAVLTDTLYTMAQVNATAVDHMLRARNVDAAALSTVQDMVDDKHERSAMQAQIHDGFFCRSNFVSASVLDGDDSKFAATFRDRAAGGAERTLVFSNRVATNAELRGANLQAKLATGAYSSLAELISQRFGTAEDSEIPYLTTTARFGLTAAVSCLEDDDEVRELLGFADEAAVHAYFQELKDNVLAPMKLGRTDLAQVWGLQTTAYGSMRQQEGGGIAAPDESTPPAPAPLPWMDMAMLAAHKA